MSASHIKKTLSPEPPLLMAWEQPALRARMRLFSVLFVVMWGLLGAGDWYMRFHWFRWQRNFIVKEAPAATAAASMAYAVTNELRLGGDLSNLIGIPQVATKYAEERPAAVHVFDAQGFRNRGSPRDRYDIVVVGDSYAATGPQDEDTFAAQLEQASGMSVYNHAAEGRGTFWSIVRFFAAERFVGHEPHFLVWPVIEREIAGDYYEGGYFQVVENARSTGGVATTTSGIDWRILHPSALHVSLPASSAYSLVAAKVWNRARYAVFGRLDPAVIASATGEPMLFYGEAVAAQKWDAKKRDLWHVTHALTNLAAMASARGMTLVMVLVPDKECVHASQLPTYASAGIQPCVLPELEQRLRDAGVAVVNLKPAFDAAVARGDLLYWRDDTHWNPRGARLGAEETAAGLQRRKP